jgi:uncharacterized cupin superfamily protein
MVPEAELKATDGGLEPAGEGWFVLNVRDAKWMSDHFGAFTRFEGRPEGRFPQLGFNIGVLSPGQASCYYHGEADQEDFLILQGECLLVIEGEERRLRQWDFVHCPPWTEHVFVGAGDGPCVLLAVGSRTVEGSEGIVYPRSELALKHDAGVEQETRNPDEAYAGIPDGVPLGYQPGWLPGD